MEITQHCPSERSGPLNKIFYVDEEMLVAVKPEQYEKLSEIAQKDFVSYSEYEKCYECGIFSFCLGRLKNQNKNNPYLQSIDDVRRLFFTDDTEFFKSQRLNKKPSKSGLVYPDIDSDIHFVTYERIYEIFMGEEYDGDHQANRRGATASTNASTER